MSTGETFEEYQFKEDEIAALKRYAKTLLDLYYDPEDQRNIAYAKKCDSDLDRGDLVLQHYLGQIATRNNGFITGFIEGARLILTMGKVEHG